MNIKSLATFDKVVNAPFTLFKYNCVNQDAIYSKTIFFSPGLKILNELWSNRFLLVNLKLSFRMKFIELKLQTYVSYQFVT